MLKHKVVTLLVFCSGFMDSIAGADGLISLPAFLPGGLPPSHMILTTHKFSSAVGTMASTTRFIPGLPRSTLSKPDLFCSKKVRGLLNWRTFLCFILILIRGLSLQSD